MFKKILLAAALVAGGAILMPSQSEAGDPHCGPYGHHGYHGHYGHYGYRAARPVVVVPNYGYGTGVPYYGPSVRYGNYYGGYSAYRPGLNISVGSSPWGGYGVGSPFGYGYGSGLGLYLGR